MLCVYSCLQICNNMEVAIITHCNLSFEGIMDIIAINGQEISLGCFVNLHTKAACVSNGIIAKINKYYVSITLGLL